MSHDKGWIGVDLDGTLAEYHGYQGPNHIGEPIPAMLLRVRRWLVAGKDVRIFTARVWPLNKINAEDKWEQFIGANEREQHAAQSATAIRAWCQKHLGQILPITCQKDYSMVQLWDDRCVQVELNTGKRADGIDDLT